MGLFGKKKKNEDEEDIHDRTERAYGVHAKNIAKALSERPREVEPAMQCAYCKTELIRYGGAWLHPRGSKCRYA